MVPSDREQQGEDANITGSITAILNTLTDSDSWNMAQLWEFCFPKLLQSVRHIVSRSPLPRGLIDEENVALSAFDSFLQRAIQNEFQQLLDRNDLWKLIGTIVQRKALNQVRFHSAEKRSEFMRVSVALDQFEDVRPSTVNANLLDVEARDLLESISDGELQQIVLMRMMGYSTPEIAESYACSVRRIQRKLQIVRMMFSDDAS